jgi:beta-phosphoglucomutase-like phosphatase (HAD superfamily)
MSGLQNILSKLPLGGSGGSDHAQEAEDIKTKAYHFDPDKVAPQEVQQRLLEILKWHDDVFRDIQKKLQMVPGLQNLLEELSNALNACKWLSSLDLRTIFS